MKVLGRVLTLAILIAFLFITPLVYTWASSTIWEWLVARDLGPGPSRAAWYGIWAITSLVIVATDVSTRTKREKQKDGWDAITHGMLRSIGLTVGVVIAVGLVWVVSTVVGWL